MACRLASPRCASPAASWWASRGRYYQVQRYFVDGHEMLYVMAFCMPRFLDQSFEDKLITLFHELYHINPRFDGDLHDWTAATRFIPAASVATTNT